MNWLLNLFHSIGHFFADPKTLQVEKTIADLFLKALPIVKDIAALTPNRTVQEINAAATKYGVTLAQTISDDPTSTGNALLNLATTVLQKNHAPDAAVSLLNTAVQLAVVASKNGA